MHPLCCTCAKFDKTEEKLAQKLVTSIISSRKTVCLIRNIMDKDFNKSSRVRWLKIIILDVIMLT